MAELSAPDRSATYRLLAAAAKVQTVASIGQPSEAYKLGARIVDEHAADLRRLADA